MMDVVKPSLEGGLRVGTLRGATAIDGGAPGRPLALQKHLRRGAWGTSGLAKRAWRKATAMEDHSPGHDTFDAVASVTSLVILVWVLAQLVTL